MTKGSIGTIVPEFDGIFETGFGPTLADGMNRMASDMVAAERLAKAAG